MFKFFKRKTKRSDWMEGLFLAERYIKDGYETEESPCGTYFWFTKKVTFCGFPTSDKRYHGVLDYIKYKKYLGSLDK